MSLLFDLLVAPFFDFVFMQRALVACWAIAFASGPVGVLLVLRRMSLIGDALSHAILPGIGLGYFLFGLWLPGLTLGGLCAGLLVAILGGITAKKTILPEDASFTGFYLISLALGVFILSIKSGGLNLMHFLFGNVLAVDQSALLFIAISCSLTLFILAIIYRPLIYECFDPLYLRLIEKQGSKWKGNLFLILFLVTVVLTLLAACQALGTLMALGIVMLPAITARLWVTQVWSLGLLASGIAILSSYLGLILSYHYNYPTGPTITLVMGGFYMGSLLFFVCGKKKGVSF